MLAVLWVKGGAERLDSDETWPMNQLNRDFMCGLGVRPTTLARSVSGEKRSWCGHRPTCERDPAPWSPARMVLAYENRSIRESDAGEASSVNDAAADTHTAQ
jgi:hypothetical protein